MQNASGRENSCKRSESQIRFILHRVFLSLVRLDLNSNVSPCFCRLSVSSTYSTLLLNSMLLPFEYTVYCYVILPEIRKRSHEGIRHSFPQDQSWPGRTSPCQTLPPLWKTCYLHLSETPIAFKEKSSLKKT